MNMTQSTNTRRDGIVAAIGVLVLLIGVATGSASAMLAMSVLALGVFAVFFSRQPPKRRALVVAVFAAAMASLIGLIMSGA